MLRKALLLFSILAATASTGQEALGRQAVVPVAKPAVNDMTSEEALVRTAYAKFAYATEQEVIYQLALEPSSTPTPKSGSSPTGDQRLASASVTFKLSDFVVGDLRDIVNRKAVDLITPPNGEMLAATPHTSSLSEGGVSTIVESIQPRWKPASVTSPEVLDATLGALHEMEWHTQAPTTTWQRYASYSVTVTFQGKSRGPYKALFIFGHDAKGNAEVMPEDANTDSMALATVLTVHLFPRPLAESDSELIPWLPTGSVPAKGPARHARADRAMFAAIWSNFNADPGATMWRMGSSSRCHSGFPSRSSDPLGQEKNLTSRGDILCIRLWL